MRTLITQTTVKVVTPFVLALAVLVLLRGHEAPGGGFPAGLLAGLWVAVREMVYGRDAVERVVRHGMGRIVGWGLLAALASGLVPMASGRSLLEVLHWEVRLPLLGRIEVSTALVFEAGIALIVVGLVVAVVQELSER